MGSRRIGDGTRSADGHLVGLVLIASNVLTKRAGHDLVECNVLASGLKSNLGYENAYRIDEQALGPFGIVGCEDRAKRMGSLS